MLTPDQISYLRDAAGKVAQPITDYLISDIARRISEAGQLTSTAAYQVWRAQQLGMSQKEIKKQLRKILGKSAAEINALLTQSAEVGYRFDLNRLPTAVAIPFEQNAVIQQTVSAAVELALSDFTNLTQTKALGFTDPYGQTLSLLDAYRSSCDFAFKQVFTGVADYNTAIRKACKNLADKGIRTINYESGVHTSLEAAIRRSILGGLGLMQEEITQQNHDDMGCDGWEISAHAASAPDHEPIQGKQYSDKEYESLNKSLVRRIGTLNCGHAAFPIILGVNIPQYTPEELEKFRTDNATGIDYQGRHYTLYDATQMQRKVERAIRTQKRRIIIDEATGDKEKLQTDQIRLVRLREEYARFSKAAGLRTQQERAEVAGFGPGQSKRATAAFENTLLPRRNAAVIPQAKFTEYALNLAKAPDKAIAFSSALGYDINNVSSLMENIRTNLKRFPATDKGDKGYGKQYEVRMDLTGPNGKTAKVITAWIDDKETGEMRLVSAYVDKKKGGSK